ncbi:MAG: phosphate signaling complex protein PhoU [Tomitella sp.]|nr:phosphate signaling complex protein PhoU [Tomitella sp.]
MRTTYNDQLEQLSTGLAAMCGVAEDAMDQATEALLQADLQLAEKVLETRPHFDELAARCEEQAFSILALQAPVAGDLRQTVSAIQIVADLRRMGALAAHIAKVAIRNHPEHAVPEEVGGHVAEMGRIAIALADAAREVLVTHDPERARGLQDEDDAMDDLHHHLLTVLMDREWRHGVAAAVDVTLLGRFYERFADHAVQVARRVIFLATGTVPDQVVDHELL